MPGTIESRLTRLERAALRFEGAHFAQHDLIARGLARLPEADFRAAMDDLATHANEMEADFGPDRIAGYREELSSIEEEVAHLRPTSRLRQMFKRG